MGRWSSKIASHYVESLNVASESVIVDVGCGTGSLSKAFLDTDHKGEIYGIEPSEAFRKRAEFNLGPKVSVLEGTASSIPLDDGVADYVISGFALNFFPDPVASMQEMMRVGKPGGVISAMVWDYADKMEMLRIFWDVAVRLDPSAEILDEGNKFPICTARKLHELFTSARLHDVQTDTVETQMVFNSIDDYWNPFLGGQGPAPAYVASLEEEKKMALKAALLEVLPIEKDGSIGLTSGALTVQGLNP